MNSKWSIIVSPKDYLSVSTGNIYLTVLKKILSHSERMYYMKKSPMAIFQPANCTIWFGYASPHQVSSTLAEMVYVSDHTRTILKSTFLPKLQALVDQHVFFLEGPCFYILKKGGRMEKGIIYFTAPPSPPPPCVAPPHCPPPSMRTVGWLPLAHVQMVLKWKEGCEAFEYAPASPHCLWRGATVTYRNPLLFYISRSLHLPTC
jgi:hypothetical protein